MNYKNLLLPFLVFPAFLFSIEKSIEITYQNHSKAGHKVDFHGEVSHDLDVTRLYLTPKASVNQNTDIDLSLGVGFRKMLHPVVSGLHVSWDVNSINKLLLNQLGLGLEWFIGDWSLKNNYYFPVFRPFNKLERIYIPIYWSDASLTRKFKYLSTSVGYIYDFNHKRCDLKGDISIPIKNMVLGVYGIYSNVNEHSICVSLSFKYPFTRSSEPVYRNYNVKYHSVGIYKPVIPVTKEPEVIPVVVQQEKQEKKYEDILPNLEVDQDEKIVPPIPEPDPSWWNWFWSWLSPTSTENHIPEFSFSEGTYYSQNSLQSSSATYRDIGVNTDPIDFGVGDLSPISSSYSSLSSSSHSVPDVGLSLDISGNAQASVADLSSPEQSPDSSFSFEIDPHYGSAGFYDVGRMDSSFISSPTSAGWQKVNP